VAAGPSIIALMAAEILFGNRGLLIPAMFSKRIAAYSRTEPYPKELENAL